MKQIGKLTQLERLRECALSMDGDVSTLSEHDQLVYNRWNEAFTMLRNYKSVSDAVALLMKRYPGLSRPTAYRDCANALQLFGDIVGSSKEGLRHLAIEMVRDGAAIARATNDAKGLIRAGLAIERIGGINKNDPDLPDFSKLEPHQYVLGLPPTLVKMLEEMGKTGRIDLTQVVDNMANFAEDAVEVEDDD